MDIQKIKRLAKDSKNLKLLYVEDDDLARVAMLDILHLFFDKIVIGVNGVDGLDKFTYLQESRDKDSVDIIITDINMPKMNGLDMIDNIRKISDDIPVIILSAYDESEFFIQSINLEISSFLFKPIALDKFITTMQKIISKHLFFKKAKINLQLLNEYKDAIDRSSIVSKTDINGTITHVNDEFCKISGYSESELIGQNHNILRHPDTSSLFFKNMWDIIKNRKEIWYGIVKNSSKSKKDYYVDSTIKPILNSNGDVVEFIAIRNDVTKLIKLNNEMKSLHKYDTEQQHFARKKIEIGIRNDMSESEASIIYTPLDILSGDFYSLYKCKNGSTFIYIIDGQGHGIPPALTVFSVSSVINNIIDSVNNLKELVDSIFPIIKTFLGEIEQLSYMMIMISEDAKTISYCSGGMYPLLIKSLDEVLRIKANNLPFMNFSQNPTVSEMTLSSWESLLLYSDGIVEHESDDLKEFTPMNLINDPSLIQSAKSKIDSCELEDDVTLLYYTREMSITK